MTEGLNELNTISIIVRLCFAAVCGGILGLERESKKRPAGFRTYILVCVGAALVMITNQYLYHVTSTGDVGRMGAQVISGIGFLGAGTIIVTGRNQVKGLTTAAGLWASACIGLAIGVGFYLAAFTSCVLILFAMAVLAKLDRRVTSRTKQLNLYVEFKRLANFRDFIEYVKEHQMKISDVEVSKTEGLHTENEHVAVLLTLRSKKKEAHEEILSKLRDLEGVFYIEEL